MKFGPHIDSGLVHQSVLAWENGIPTYENLIGLNL